MILPSVVPTDVHLYPGSECAEKSKMALLPVPWKMWVEGQAQLRVSCGMPAPGLSSMAVLGLQFSLHGGTRLLEYSRTLYLGLLFSQGLGWKNCHGVTSAIVCWSKQSHGSPRLKTS